LWPFQTLDALDLADVLRQAISGQHSEDAHAGGVGISDRTLDRPSDREGIAADPCDEHQLVDNANTEVAGCREVAGIRYVDRRLRDRGDCGRERGVGI